MPGELSPPGGGWALTPPELVVLGFVVVVVRSGALLRIVGVVGVVGVLAVPDVADGLVVVAAAEALEACLEAPHPLIASAAISAPES